MRISSFIISLFLVSLVSLCVNSWRHVHAYGISIQEAQKFLRTIPGFEGRTGALEQDVSRAEFFKAVTGSLYTAEQIETCLHRHDFQENLLFKDAESNRWYAPFACSAWENNLISGYADGTLQPDKKINIAEAAKVLTIAFGLGAHGGSHPWYTVFLESLQRAGVLPSGPSYPHAHIPRIQMADMLSRLTGRTPDSEDAYQMVGWIPYWDQDNAFQSFQDNVDLFTDISFFWYRLDANGKVNTYQVTREDLSMVEYAKRHGVRTFGLIANLPDYTEGGTWDSSRVQKAIGTSKARKEHVEALVALAKRNGFDGINIDYESLKTDLKDEFSAFIHDLGDALRAEGKQLSVAIHPKTGEGNPWEDNGSHAQDWKQLSKGADQLHFMTYGEHYVGSDAGPVASVGWLHKVIDYAIEDLRIPTTKIYVGLPLYGQEWYQDDSGKMIGVDDEMTMREAEEKRLQYGAQVEFDTESSSPFFSFFMRERSGKKHVVWTENAQSINDKVDLAKRHGIRNLALWRLGGDTPEVWPTLRNFIKPQ